jgi:hypothetical protein
VNANKNKPAGTPADDIGQWLPLEYVYDQFVQAYPLLGLKPGRWPLENIKRHHKAELMAQDVIRRMRSGKWHAHETRFAPALFEVLTRAPKPRARAAA